MNTPSSALSSQIDLFKTTLKQLENDNSPGMVADITLCFVEVLEELLALEEHKRDFQVVPWRLEQKFTDLRVRVCYQNVKSPKRIKLIDLDHKIKEVAGKMQLFSSMKLAETRQLLVQHIELMRKFERTRILRPIALVELRQHFVPKDIWEAAEVGAVKELEETINDLWRWERSAFVNQVNENGSSAFQLAAYRNQVAVMQLLLASGADLFVKDKHTYQALHWTAKGGALDAAHWLVTNKADVNARAEYGRTPLHLAAYNNHPEMVALLLSQGANPNLQAQADGSVTPLHEAVTKDNSLIVELLMRSDLIDVDLRDAQNHTPFYYAILSGHVEIAESLISHLSWRKCLLDDADPNHPNHLLKKLPSSLHDDTRRYLVQLLTYNQHYQPLKDEQ